MRHIYIRTFAYNAEKTLRRAVNSIINQTYPHFTYYLLDNGSTDNTRRIIKEYAAQDKRIVPFYTDENMVFGPDQDAFLKLTENLADDDLFCVLDADDEYEINYFEASIKFLEENGLDIVCCGSQWIDSTNGRIIGGRSLQEPLIVSGFNFAEFYPYYHVFMRTVWGKLSNGYCVREYVTKRDPNDRSFPDYGIDTWDMMAGFKRAKRIGIIPGTLHRYYISPKSGSYQLSKKRILSDQLLHKASLDFLSQYGEINSRNWDFLYLVYMNAMKDTLNVLLNAQISISEKLSGIIQIFSCDYTRQLAARQNFGAFLGQLQNVQQSRKDLFMSVANWMLGLEEVPDEMAENFCSIGEFICAAADYANGWIEFQKLQVSVLITQGKLNEVYQKLAELETLLPNDNEISALKSLATQEKDK